MTESQTFLAPHLVVGDGAAAIDFYVKAFGAAELGRVPGPDGKLMHAALTINGSNVYLNDDFPEMCGGKSQTPTAFGGTPVVSYHDEASDVWLTFWLEGDYDAMMAAWDGATRSGPLRPATMAPTSAAAANSLAVLALITSR